MKNVILMVLAMMMAIPNIIKAQEEDYFGVWMSAGVKKRINKKAGVSAWGEWRTKDGFSTNDRWELGVQGDYNIVKWLKADMGYVFLNNYKEERLSNSEKYIIEDYWIVKHRGFASLTGKMNFGGVGLSLRERYQMTHNGEKTVKKYKVKNDKESEKVIEASTEHILKSRLQVSYGHEGWIVEPFASVEMYNDLKESMNLTKVRYTAGVELSLGKKNEVEVYYRYQDVKGNANSSILGIGYTFRL